VLTIRQEQMTAFEDAAMAGFEDAMVAHVQEHFPEHYEILGEPAVRKTIRLGIDRGAVHGFITEHDLCLFISLMFFLGSAFDEDPQLPWAADTLDDVALRDPAEQSETLFDRAVDYIVAVAGEEGEHVRRAMASLREQPPLERFQPPTGNFESRAIHVLHALWPEKCTRLGDDVLDVLVTAAVERARHHELRGDRGPALCLVLMFMLGAGFDTDPQFPWIEQTLAERAPAPQDTRVDRLYEQSMAFLDKWLA